MVSLRPGLEPQPRNHPNPPVMKLLVGGQNSGKTSWIANHFTVDKTRKSRDQIWVRDANTNEDWLVLSRDRVREAYADTQQISYQETFPVTDTGKVHNEAVNRRFNQLLRHALELGESVMIDNTNMRVADRAPLIAMANEFGENYRKEALIFEVDVEEAVRRNAQRDANWSAAGKPTRAIPEPVIRSTYASYAAPTAEEGLDHIAKAAAPAVRKGDGARGR